MVKYFRGQPNLIERIENPSRTRSYGQNKYTFVARKMQPLSNPLFIKLNHVNNQKYPQKRITSGRLRARFFWTLSKRKLGPETETSLLLIYA